MVPDSTREPSVSKGSEIVITKRLATVESLIDGSEPGTYEAYALQGVIFVCVVIEGGYCSTDPEWNVWP